MASGNHRAAESPPRDQMSSELISRSSSTIPTSVDVSIADEKRELFSRGVRRKSPWEKTQEEAEAKRRKHEEETAALMDSFVQSFEGPEEDKHGGRDSARKPETHRDVRRHSDERHVRSQGDPNHSKYKKRNMDEFLSELKREHDSRSLHPSLAAKRKHEDGNAFNNTTNIFVSNLAPNISEGLLHSVFSEYGAVDSVKVIWPRSSERRSTLTGFVSFLTRTAAERAFERLAGEMVKGYPLRLRWGRPARRISSVREVVIPKDSRRRSLIDGFVRSVFQNPSLEQRAWDSERRNPEFRFLYDSLENPETLYFRWRLGSARAGETMSRWSGEPMTIGDEKVLPPPQPESGARSGHSPNERVMCVGDVEEWQSILAGLTVKRTDIAKAMVFAVRRSDFASDVTGHLRRALMDPETSVQGTVACLFLINDILHNCAASVSNVSVYRALFEEMLPEVFSSLNERYFAIDGRVTATYLKERVLSVLDVWRQWSLYDESLVRRLGLSFLKKPEHSPRKVEVERDDMTKSIPTGSTETTKTGDDVNSEDGEEVNFWSLSRTELERLCVLCGTPAVGTDDELVERLRQQANPSEGSEDGEEIDMSALDENTRQEIARAQARGTC